MDIPYVPVLSFSLIEVNKGSLIMALFVKSLTSVTVVTVLLVSLALCYRVHTSTVTTVTVYAVSPCKGVSASFGPIDGYAKGLQKNPILWF